MPSLREQLSSGSKRQEVIEDALHVLDEEVAEKSGLTGLAIKGAYKLVKGIKPGFIREVVDNLLDEFVDAVDPLYQEALEKKEPLAAHIRARGGELADALLAITDRRAERAKNQAVKSAYGKLRPTAKKHVEAAAPRLGAMLERHALH